MFSIKQYPGFQSACFCLKNGQFQDALTQFKVLINENFKLYPDVLTYLYKQTLLNAHNPSLGLIIAEIYFYLKRYSEAVDELEELIENYPDLSAGFILLQKIYQQQQEKVKVRQLFEQAFFLHKNYDLVILDFLQHIYLQENDIVNSIIFYQKLITLYPHNVIYHKNLLEMYLKDRQFDFAFDISQKIIEISPYDKLHIAPRIEEILANLPNRLDIREILIRLYLSQYQPDQALNHLNQLLAIAPQKRKDAVQIYKDALGLFPDMPEILIDLSKLLADLQEYSESVFYLRTAFEKTRADVDKIIAALEVILSKYPDQILALLLLSDIYFEKADYQKCLSYLDLLILIDSQELDLLEEKVQHCLAQNNQLQYAELILTKIEIAKENYDLALQKIERLLHKEYDFDARKLKMQIYEKKHEQAHVLTTLSETIKLYPFSLEAHQELKRNHDFLLSEQINSLLKELNLANGKITAQKEKKIFSLAILYLRKGEISQAVNYFQMIVSSSKLGDSVQILIGRCFMELSRYDLAVNHLKRVLDKLQKTDIKLANKVRFLLSINYILLGKIEIATDYLDSILEFDINFPNIQDIVNRYKQLSFMDFKGKAVSGCLNFTDHNQITTCTVPEKEPASMDSLKSDYINISFSYTHNNKGVDNVLKENFKAAEDEFLLAIQMDPQLYIAHCNLALIYILNQQFDLALTQLRSAEVINPKCDTVYLSLGLLFFLQKDYPSAISNFKKAIQHNNKNYLAFLNLGDVYYAQGDLQEAFYYWQKAATALNLGFFLYRRLAYLNQNQLDTSDWQSDFQYNIDEILATLKSN